MPERNLRIVLTGGPCAGKTTLAGLLARANGGRVVRVPEAASLLFSGGFPRFGELESRRATQRAIYHTQRELECTYACEFPAKALLFDRGTLDGAAYWPEGPAAFFSALGTSLEAELARYSQVIYLDSAAEADYELHRRQNPNRTETWEEARRLEEATFPLWARHPYFVHIRNNSSFPTKVSAVLSAVSEALGAPEGGRE